MIQDEAVRRLGTGDLLRRLVNNISAIVDREVELAKEEAKSEAITVGTGTGLLALGGLMIYTVLPAIVVAIIYAINPTLPPVTVALITAAVFLVLGAILALVGWNMVKVKPMERTRESVKEDIQWARSRMTSQGR